MALLAEQKRKVKHGLDPQNMSWSNDNSKIGQRMMEKMGWAKGKGLGANESGMTEHIKASYKSDTKGLGSTPQTVDAWIAHQDDFNDLLKMLNSQSEADAPVQEKTEKEKHVDGHKRYYGRFARGQAQTLRSVDDLNCIFGRRKSKSDKTEANEHSATNSGSDETEEKRHGLTTVTSTSSVQEYFAKKMADMKARKKENNVQDDAAVDGDEAAGGTTTDKYKTENKSVYGAVNFSYNNGDDKASPRHDSSNGIDSEKKSRGWYDNFTKDNSEGDLKESSTKRKKKKKDKQGSDDNDSNVEVKKSSKKDKAINDSESSKKVLKSLEVPSSASVAEENTLTSERKKSERNTSHKSSADMQCTDGADEKSERKKKKKKKSKKEQINSDDEKSDSNIALPAQPKGKHKDKKIDSDTLTSKKAHSTNKPGTDSTDTLGNSNDKKNCDSIDDTQENKRKKKQKRKHSQIDEEGSPVETSSKKKKKRRKDTCDNEPEEDTAGNVNTDSKDALSGKEESLKEDTGNKVTTTDGIFSPEQLRKHERRLSKKERKKEKELKKAKQDSANNDLFLGSNITEIVGYGITPARKSKRKR